MSTSPYVPETYISCQLEEKNIKFQLSFNENKVSVNEMCIVLLQPGGWPDMSVRGAPFRAVAMNNGGGQSVELQIIIRKVKANDIAGHAFVLDMAADRALCGSLDNISRAPQHPFRLSRNENHLSRAQHSNEVAFGRVWTKRVFFLNHLSERTVFFCVSSNCVSFQWTI
ncbi:hypothetical protein CEXT_451911 [Caerostris extrusa]|uniref:Uncharacterized protein n=1 Tax=Caerostris extrusa TaxID=172846 RepID=A0AAV4P7A0_CAEEX|nr:hypothetical protein CEXT_451911 [Caerostris extrusa]